MRKWIFAAILASFALATAALAADPWKQKKPSEWKQEDVHKILNDSPWTRRYDVILTQNQIAEGLGPGGGSDTGNTDLNGGSGGIISGGGGGRRGRGSNSSDAETRQQRQIAYVAQWYSSRTVRAAHLRSAELQGSPVPEDNALHKVPENYQVLLQGANAAAFDRIGEEVLKKTSYLELKKNHQRIAPSRVVILRGRGRVVGVAFEFPKKSASGEPTIGSDEKDIDFVAGGDNLNLKFHFDLDKMVDQQGADL